ncbi:hypothetical protein D8674_021144 [Pyrus ussuriensis x Pyrus communis]|uniref:Uncharacterized protein n=1 Tax=Pyrus ussuriensis x Pyrus communis TaxID=2448454 RepID=A0A5N5HHR0_9ROSA|nr:hypothetical protein D8674_021144 [Pyrus ussuriensis x Pyrus communis]
MKSARAGFVVGEISPTEEAKMRICAFTSRAPWQAATGWIQLCAQNHVSLRPPLTEPLSHLSFSLSSNPITDWGFRHTAISSISWSSLFF